MSVVVTAPDRDLVWRTKVESFGGAVNRPLDGLPAPMAAWWPSWQLFSTYALALLDAENEDGSPSVSPTPGSTGQVLAPAIAGAGALQNQFAIGLRDQSGNARTVTATSLEAPKIYDQATRRFEQQNLSLALQFNGARTMTRNDALGLAADPALTIAWKMQAVAPVGSAPTVLSLGDAIAPELNAYFGDTDIVTLGSFDGLMGGNWWLDPGTVTGLHSYIITKPAGTGYDAATWALYVDGVSIPLHDTAPGALAIGSALTQIGDVPGGGFPFNGSLAGIVVWAEVLDGSALAQLQAFLDSV